MRKCVVLLSFLISASSLYAQKPTIDSMIVDEDSSRLALYGGFGSNTGTVTVNGDTLAILNWSDTAIIATISDTGIGSAGPVVVRTPNGTSDLAMLTSISGNYQTESGFREDPDGYYAYFDSLSFHLRFDLHSLLTARLPNGHSYKLTRNSLLYVLYDEWLAHGVNGYAQSEFASSFEPRVAPDGREHFQCFFETQNSRGKGWYFDLWNMDTARGTGSAGSVKYRDSTYSVTYYQSDLSGSLQLDSEYQLVTFYHLPPPLPPPYFGYTGMLDGTALSGSVSYLPAEIAVLSHSPVLVSPRSDSMDWHPDLTWHTLTNIDSFEIEISPDSVFKTGVHDYITHDTAFIPNDLTTQVQYYWRVRGRNEYGATRWSSVWSFGENASSVRTTNDEISPLLQVTGSSIEYRVSSAADLLIYNVLGEEVSRLRCEANGTLQSIPLAALNLGGGPYFAILRSSGVQLICRFGLQP